jgi:probable phosphoglycerate mutase
LHHEASTLAPSEVGAGGTFWLIRHGEVHNPKQIFYGRMPRFHLSVHGVAEAAETGRFLSSNPLAAVYASPLLRARQTAAEIAKPHHIKVGINKLLLEVRTLRQGELLANLDDFNFYEPPASPDDETLDVVLGRVQAFMGLAMQRHHGQHVAAVSHGDPVVVTHAYFCDMPVRLASLRKPNMYPQHASVTRYDWPPEGFTLDTTRVRVSYWQQPFSYESNQLDNDSFTPGS